MSLFKILSVFIGFVAFAASQDRSSGTGSAVDPYSIGPLPGDLVVNGGFEQVSPIGWSFVAPGGFTERFCEADVAFSGVCLGSFGSHTALGSIFQTISTAPNTDYIVNFHLRCENNLPSSFSFKWDSVQYYFIQNDVLHDYQLHTFAVSTTSGGPVVITFEGQNDGSFFDLDDVSVVVLPVPCDPNFYEFDPQTGDIKAESGKIYPGPPQPDSTFPVITDAGELLFNYHSDAISQTLPRVITLGLAPPTTAQTFVDTQAVCQFRKAQDTGCPTPYTDIGFVFGFDQTYTIQDDFESLYVKQCVARTVASDFSTVTYSGYVFTLYMDAYNLGNRWSELKPISFSMTLPYAPTASTTAIVDVVSDVVAVEYQPLEVINQGTGSPPIIQFTTIARSYYPFVAYGTSASYTPPSSAPSPISDPSASSHGTCVLYRPDGQVASTSTFCDANAALCTVECTRIISLTAPACDLSGYDWTFTFSEFQDYSTTADATTPVADASLTPFSEELLFDSSPVWNVCPTADASDYSRFIHSEAVHGHYDASTGDAVPDPTTAAAINTPLSFGFKIFVLSDSSGNPDSSSATLLYRARLTEMVVMRPDSTNFFLVGSSSNPTIGGNGANQDRVTGLTFTPNPSAGPVFDMYISPQGYLQPNFASIQVSFTPKVGNPSDSMLYYSDSSASSGVTLTVTFAGVISLFADGSTPGPSKRDIHFRRQITLSPNGTFANPNQVINSTSSQNSTTIVIQVPKLAKAINSATIAGSVVGALVGLGLLAVAFVLYKRSKKANEFVITSEKLESGSI